MLCYTHFDSPIGQLTLVGSAERGLHALHMQSAKYSPTSTDGWSHVPHMFSSVLHQLDQYFAGKRRVFELQLAAEGTPFQRRVWAALSTIPFGQTVSYGDIARQIGQPTAVRAVGAANGRNPIGIIVPCHRVIGADGSLTGYAGGEDRKRWLLDHEKRVEGPTELSLFSTLSLREFQ
jgi:methylated-DNA-[protein]-cysteine S-methyltransferase